MEAICDPCTEKNKRFVAEKYCSDCEEKLCTECAEWHLRCKVFRSHHVIDLPSVGSRIPPSSKISMTSSVSVIFYYRLDSLTFSTMCQSYNLVLLMYRKVKMNF
jgi:hypothetical protein